MTGSLPINQYNSTIAEVFAKKFTDEIHILNVEIPRKSVKVEIEFEFVKILQEGVSTTFALETLEDKVFNEFNNKYDEKVEVYNIKLSKDYFKSAERRILHIAIGEGTTEYPLTTGKKFDPNFIYGSNNGVGHGIDDSLDEFKEEIGVSTYSRQKFSEIIREESHKYHLLAKEILDFHLEKQSAEILKNTKREIERANNEVDMILVYGGGSILMRNTLEKKLEDICNRAKINLLYLDKPFAITIECKGLYAFTNSKIFEVIKKRNTINA